ncbi:MAG: anthranilate phosphoribosyltransferase [Andreesenia angusta]|nr:anthranilate phosphoribosyltransferase [Andreesenia angusta]
MEIREYMNKLINGDILRKEEAKSLMEDIIAGKLNNSQIASILTSLKIRGENKDEIIGFSEAMRENANKLNLKEYSIDTCGTGGDGMGTFNISTLVSIITSAGGVNVAKHGNRSISSKSGSADIFTGLGYNIEMDKELAEKSLEETGFAFIFAPKYNKSMKNVATVRRELGIRTVFNLMGPIIHPGNIKGQMVGIYDSDITNLYAEVLKSSGRERAMVVHGNDGLDEISITTTTKVSELKDGEIKDYILDPREYGFKFYSEDHIKGGSPSENIEIMMDILNGKKGAKRDITVLNSGAALYVGRAAGSYREGIELAEEILDSGRGLKKLNDIIEYNRELNK